MPQNLTDNHRVNELLTNAGLLEAYQVKKKNSFKR